jgi:hypothetical protein
MEWLALALWISVLLVALPLARGVLQGRFSLGLQAMAAGAGLALIVGFLSTDNNQETLAWIASGVALVGLLATSAGAVSLIVDHEDGVSVSTGAEEFESGLAGVQLPLFSVTLILTLMVALGIGTST